MSEKRQTTLEQQYSHEVDKCSAEFGDALLLFFLLWGIFIVGGLIFDLIGIKEYKTTRGLIGKSGFFWFWAACLFGWIAALIAQWEDGDTVLKKYNEWENAIAMLALIRKYPSEDSQLIINAHNRASRIGVSSGLFEDWQKPIRADVFQRMMGLFLGYSESTLSELEEKRAERGLDNPRNEWFDAGKTLDDGALQAAYLKKLNPEETIIKATEQTIVQAEVAARSAATLGEKKTREQKRQGLEQELEKYVGERSQDEPEELKNLGGRYVIHSINGEKAKIVFTLPAGEYIAELYDFREQRQESEGFRVEQDGGLYILKLSGRGFSEHTEITLINKETGAKEEIQLW